MDTFKEQNEHINLLSVNMEEAIRNALECFSACNRCIKHCLSMGGAHRDSGHITLLLECSEISRLASQFMRDDSNFMHDVCGICARLCEASASSCEEIGPHDEEMQTCARVCRQCAESCRNMEH